MVIDISLKNDKAYFGLHVLLNVLLYAPIYFLNLASIGSGKTKFYFAFETHIPLIGWMIIPYLSLWLLFLFPLFLLPRPEVKKISVAFALCTVFSGIVFFVFPTDYGFTRIIPDGFAAPLYAGLFRVDPYVNAFPSLHVAYAVLFLIWCVRLIHSVYVRIFFVLWVALVIVSTLFTHQHHVFDVIAGVALACATWRIVTGKGSRGIDQYS